MDKSAFGNYTSLVSLFDEIGGEKHKERAVMRFVNNYNSCFKDVLNSDMSAKTKRKVFTWMKREYKNRIFNDMRVITHNEKRWLYNYVITKWRREARDIAWLGYT